MSDSWTSKPCSSGGDALVTEAQAKASGLDVKVVPYGTASDAGGALLAAGPHGKVWLRLLEADRGL